MEEKETRSTELLTKIHILKEGVILERKKNEELESEVSKLRQRIKELECINLEKETSILNLSRENYEYINKLEIEKSKNESKKTTKSGSMLSYFFDDSSELEKKISLLDNENIELKKQIENIYQKFEAKIQNSDDCKAQYQELINMQLNKIKSLEIHLKDKNDKIEESQNLLNQSKEEIEKLNLKLSNFTQTLSTIINERNEFEMLYSSEIEKFKKLNNEYQNVLNKNKELIMLLQNEKDEKQTFEELYLKEKSENERNQEKYSNYDELIKERDAKIEFYQNAIQKQADDNAILANSLAEIKNNMIDDKMQNQWFKAKKVGILFNPSLDVYFQKNEVEYFFVLKEINNISLINVEDIEYMKFSEKYENALEVYYLVIFNNLISLISKKFSLH